MLKTTRFQSMAIGSDGIPSMAILPPWHMFSSMVRSADGAPDISKPTSNPSRIPSSSWTSDMVRCLASTAKVAPIRLARSRRNGFTSETTTCRAPAYLTIAVAIKPIGPAPVISTSSPRQSKLSAVCTALPSGSKIAAIS